MRSLIATTKALAKSFAILAVLYLSLHHLADFSEKQSIALAFMAWVGYGLFEGLRASSRLRETFTPFYVCIRPNWYELLRDYKVIESDEETFWRATSSAWDKLQSDSRGASVPGYSALRSDIFFSVLQPRANAFLPGLIYWDSRRRFVSEVEFEEQIEEIHIEHPTFKGHGWKPGVYFKSGTGGYELGVDVHKDWWANICAADETKELARTKAHANHLTGRTRLVVAILPYSEFDIYFYGKPSKKRDAQLAEHGWKREELDPELELLGAPDCVRHKYFTIEHRSISI